MTRTHNRRYLNSREMAAKIHALLFETTKPDKLPKGQTHHEALMAILENYAKNPRSIEPVAVAYRSRSNESLFDSLAKKLSQENYIKIHTLIMFLRHGGPVK